MTGIRSIATLSARSLFAEISPHSSIWSALWNGSRAFVAMHARRMANEARRTSILLNSLNAAVASLCRNKVAHPGPPSHAII
jgi:hypothetical protein